MNSYLDLLESVAGKNGEKTALVFPSSRDVTPISFASLYERVLRVGACLLEEGLLPGDRVGLLLGNSAEFVLSFLGCLASGLVPVALRPPRKPEHFQKSLEALSSFKPLLIVSEASAPGCKTLEEIERRSSRTSFQRVKRSAESLAYIQCTSGSTSTPQGCCISEQGLLHQMSLIGSRLTLTDGDVCLNWLPFYHDMGLVGALLTSLARGMTAFHHNPSHFVRDPGQWADWVETTSATFTGLPGFAMDLLARVGSGGTGGRSSDCSSLRVVVLGAEQIHERPFLEFKKKLGGWGVSEDAFVIGYGMAEATLTVAFSEPGPPRFSSRLGKEALPFAVASLGRPVQDCQVEVVRPDGSACPDREIGEITFRSPSMMLGYWPLTRTRRRDEFFRTGDVGFIDQGQLYLVGRTKELIIRGGENYSPSVFEDIAINSGIATVVAVGVPDPLVGTENLYIVAEGPTDEILADRVALLIFEATDVPVHDWVWVPKGWIPCTTNGKKSRLLAKEKLLAQFAASPRK